jgi:hypothetical protein
MESACLRGIHRSTYIAMLAADAIREHDRFGVVRIDRAAEGDK